MSDITNETDRLRVAAERRRKALVVREMVAAIDDIIGRPDRLGQPALAVQIAAAIVAGEIPHTRAVFNPSVTNAD